MSTVPTPTTPTTQVAEEHDVNEISEDELLQLDLNPDLEDVQDIAMDKEEEQTYTHTLKRTHLDDYDKGLDEFDDIDDFKPSIDLNSPFESHSSLASLKHTPQSNSQPVQTRRLSLSQQSKFISYIDEQLLHIQRKFVQSRGLNTEQGYGSLAEVLRDFKKLVDFIWYSIDGVSNTDAILQEDLENTEKFRRYDETKSTNFGQWHYLIRIADDLLDYIDKFPIGEDDDLEDGEESELRAEKEIAEVTARKGSSEKGATGGFILPDDSQDCTVSPKAHGTLRKLFKLISILDYIFARLIDGTVPGNFKISGTETVRLTGIAERTRLMLPKIMEKNGLHGYHYEISKVYQETLERGT